MAKRKVAAIAAVLVIVGMLAGYRYLSGSRLEKEIGMLFTFISATNDITYGAIYYNASKDSAIVTDVQVNLEEKGLLTIHKLTLDRVYASDRRFMLAEGVEYVTKNSYGSVLKADKIRLHEFGLASFITFLNSVQNSADYLFFPSWLSSPFDMDSCDTENFVYTQDNGLVVTIEHFGWKGPLVEEEIPARVSGGLSNMLVSMGGRSYSVSNISYLRYYDNITHKYEEKFENVVLDGMFSVNFEYALSDFNITHILTFDNKTAMKEAILENARLNSAEFTYQDLGFMSAVTDALTDLVNMDGKRFLSIWFETELSRFIPNIQDEKALSSSLAAFIHAPEQLTISMLPKVPVPLKGIESGDSTYFNQLNIQLYINDFAPVQLKHR